MLVTCNVVNWVVWEEVIKPKKDGGLGVGCLNGANLAFLSK